ncbi:MAG TPA: hypothetical protein VMO26_03510 [Vicinamibacterales bacterium]|nr:hypothetical protein [Vicinamibacterales bacterium]
MKRILASVGLLAATVLMLGPDLQACGDKSLSAGGIRMQRAMAARNPASVLMYAPAASRLNEATQKLKLQRTLLQFGHKYREVVSWAEFQDSIASGQYNLVLADVADLVEVQQKLESASSSAIVVPVAYKLTKAEIKELEKQCRFLIKAPSRQLQYLNVIHTALEARSTIPRRS